MTTRVVKQIDWRAGDDWEIEAKFTDVNGDDLTDLSAIEWKLSSADLTTNIVTKTLGAGIVVGTSPYYLISVADTETAVIPPGLYVHSARVTTAGGEVSTQFIGRINVLANPA